MYIKKLILAGGAVILLTATFSGGTANAHSSNKSYKHSHKYQKHTSSPYHYKVEKYEALLKQAYKQGYESRRYDARNYKNPRHQNLHHNNDFRDLLNALINISNY